MILRLDEEAALDVVRAGGKGASLAAMTRAGLAVPPGFVVEAEALRTAIAAADREDELRGLLRVDAEPSAIAAAAEALVRGLAPTVATADAVGRAYATLGDEAEVAVRSSAVAEDSETASYAGQQETFLHVRGAESVVARVRDCWASFFSERALVYRGIKGSLDDLRMAVVVQRMVTPDIAGVLFTIDPVRRRRDQMVIEAVIGLGEGLVSGQLTPDNYVVARDGRLKRSTIAVQTVAVRRAPDGGTCDVPLDPAEGGRQKLDADVLARLAELGERLEHYFGRPQDVEWALAGDELFLLQSRPVTAA